MKKVVIIGTAYPYRGGMAAYNERLAEEFQQHGDSVQIYTFTLQYPDIVFPGKTQFSDSPPPLHLDIKQAFSSINPLSWIKAGREIKALKADIVICPFWLPFMSPCFSTMLRLIKQNGHSRILSIIHNAIPHEQRLGDRPLAQLFVNHVDAFIVMSKSVGEDMKQFIKDQKVRFIPHPVYDNYGEILDKSTARNWLKLPVEGKYMLFFGLIRDYKGLDLLIKAMADTRILDRGIQLIIAGEYYGNKAAYEQLIEEQGVRDRLILHTIFIPNEEVKYFFSAADLVVQPYKSATQSGISQLCYHFEKPMVVTNVGGLPEIVQHEQSGYVVAVNETAIADAILAFYDQNKEVAFSEAVKTIKKAYSWDTMVEGTKELLFPEEVAVEDMKVDES